MKVGLFNSNPAWGGGERWFFDTAKALAERRHHVVRVAQPGTPLHERWGVGAVSDTALSALCSGPDALEVLICNSGRELRRALRVLPRSSRTRLVLRRGLDRPLRDNWVRRRSWRRLTAILVNSDATGTTVRQSLPWFPEDRIRRIYNPVRPLPDTGSPNFAAPVQLGIVGRLVRQKGIDLLLDGLAAAPVGFDWHLRVVGEGALREDLTVQAADLGIADRIDFVGHVASVTDIYSGIDLVVIPSRYEGFCFVAAEAALAARPVVATRVSSLPEVVDEGRTGVLVEPEDPAALAQAIVALVGSPERAVAMGLEGRRRAREMFAPEAIHEELEGLLAEVANWSPVGRSS